MLVRSITHRLPLRATIWRRAYSNINDFNKNKTEYNYGTNFKSLDEIEAKTNPEVKVKKIQEDIAREQEERERLDINAILEKDPTLVALTPHTAEYKQQLSILHQAYRKSQQKQLKKFETRERFKELILGIVVILSVIAAHQIFMNYEYLKSSLLQDYYYKIENKAKDLKREKKSVLSLPKDISERVYLDSADATGIYYTDSKYFLRIPAFDNMTFRDVQVDGEYIVAITDNGKVYHYTKNSFYQVHLPSVSKCQISEKFVYYLTTAGEVIYTPKDVSKLNTSRSWLGRKSIEFGKIDLPQKIKDFSTGECHLLLLTKSGSIFVANTSEKPSNFGQYGLPSLSPFSPEVPLNKAFPLTLLNNEIVIDKKGRKSVKPKVFTHISTGKYHNIVVDSEDNIYTWGKNDFGQCGIEVNLKNDYYPLPRLILQKPDYKRICKTIIKDSESNDFSVDNVYAGNSSSYIQLKHKNESILLSFGTGLKGQLGTNQYKHVSSQPQPIKSIYGLNEFNESVGKTTSILIKDVSINGDHAFVTLNNTGNKKDVIAFGDNESGQFGNGKIVKSSKPIQLPKLIEPNEINEETNMLTKRLNDVNTFRLTLLDNVKVDRKNIEQVVVGGQDASVIYYRKK